MVIETRAGRDRGAREGDRTGCGRCGSAAGTIHQVCLPWHWGTYTTNAQGVTGDSANDLVADRPATRTCRSRSPRRSAAACARAAATSETTQRLAGIDSTPEPADAGATHPPSGRRARASTTSTAARTADMTEIAIHTREPSGMGFFTDTTTCIGCKACEVACKQWNDLPADGIEFRTGLLRPHRLARPRRGGTCASSRRARTDRADAPEPTTSTSSTPASGRGAATAGCSCPTSASTARTPAASTPARPAR